MEFKLNNEESKRRRAFADLCEKELQPAAEKVDVDGDIPDSHWRTLADAGYLGLGLDKNFGGEGSALAFWACMGEQLARCCPSTYAAVNSTSHLFGCMVQMFGSADQKQRYLPSICSGEIRAAVAHTDTKTGSDEDPGLVTAQKTDGGYVLSGVKPYVINGPACDAVLVSASSNSTDESPKKLFFILDADAEGLVRSKRQPTMGIRGAQVGSMTDCTFQHM